MIEFDNGTFLIENISELPRPTDIDALFLDFETGSGDSKKDSFNPFHHCFPIGFGVTWDDHPRAYYVPFAHKHGPNAPQEHAFAWLRDVMQNTQRWINHNVKYDAHVYERNIAKIPESVRLVCTVVGSKLVDSDRLHYSLDHVSRDWLHEDITGFEDALAPYKESNKDYSLIPSDIMAPYAGQDALSVRRLGTYLDANMHSDCIGVWKTEIELTRVLLEMEQIGVRVDPQMLRKKELVLLASMCLIEEKLSQIVGRAFRPHVNEDCFDVLCNQYGLPVLAWTNTKDNDPEAIHNPSFDKHALAAYSVFPGAPRDVISLLITHRKMNTMSNFFVKPYQEQHVNGVLHPSHNQCVRTGRLSCKDPNTMQLSKEAKELILPHNGTWFISTDASQIEFRTITHYIDDPDIVAAYQADPDTDFHAKLAAECGIHRQAAKTLNFAAGYGQGKKSTVKLLSENPDIIEDVTCEIEALAIENRWSEGQKNSAYKKAVVSRGEKIYEDYHARMPGIRRTSRKAERLCRERGYVKNLYGRHRNLPNTRAHTAFNTVNQSTAADKVKNRMVELHKQLRGTPIRMLLQVHDEILFDAPPEIASDENVLRQIVSVLEYPDIKMRVPIRWQIGAHGDNWRKASSDEVQRTVSDVPLVADFGQIKIAAFA